MSLGLAVGLPETLPEMPILLVGFKAELVGMSWGIENIEHLVSEKGGSSTINIDIN